MSYASDSVFDAQADSRLRDALRHCSPSAYSAARAYREAGDASQIPSIVTGVLERYVEKDLRHRLAGASDDLRLLEHLGIDSLSMMELGMVMEDVLEITLSNDELRTMTTVGEVKRLIERRARETIP